MEHNESILGNINVEVAESTGLQKFISNAIDIIIEIVIIIAFYFLVPRQFVTTLLDQHFLMKYFIALLLVFSYRLLCMLLAGRTFGMMITRSKYLNSRLLPLSQKERMIAAFIDKAAGIKRYQA